MGHKVVLFHTLAAANGSLCSYSRYLSRLKNVLKKMYAILQFFKSLNFIQPVKQIKTHKITDYLGLTFSSV